jgi:hypothetical protein
MGYSRAVAAQIHEKRLLGGIFPGSLVYSAPAAGLAQQDLQKLDE